MSSTTGDRHAHDDYPTPPWATQRLLDRVWLPRGHILEPCAGRGQIVDTVRADYAGRCFTAVELQQQHQAGLEAVCNGIADEVVIGDFLELAATMEAEGRSFDAVITNPPYSLAFEFLDACRKLAPWVAMLLRVGFLEGGASDATRDRRAMLEVDMPDVYLLPNRPPFARSKKTGRFGTDSCTYAWMVWGPQAGARGHVEVLDLTPREERSEWIRELGEAVAP